MDTASILAMLFCVFPLRIKIRSFGFCIALMQYIEAQFLAK